MIAKGGKRFRISLFGFGASAWQTFLNMQPNLVYGSSIHKTC
jgi:hypothetical protein